MSDLLNTKRCIVCKTNIPNESVFCIECGARQIADSTPEQNVTEDNPQARGVINAGSSAGQNFVKYFLFAVIVATGYLCWHSLYPEPSQTQQSQQVSASSAAAQSPAQIAPSANQQPLNDNVIELMRFMVEHQTATKAQISNWLRSHNFPALHCDASPRDSGSKEDCKSGGMLFQVDIATGGVASLKFDTDPASFQGWHEAFSRLFTGVAEVKHENDPVNPFIPEKKMLEESFTWTSAQSTPCAVNPDTMRCPRWLLMLVNSHEEPETTVVYMDAVEGNAAIRRAAGAAAFGQDDKYDHPKTGTNSAIGLMWANESNSSDVTWNEAHEYCSNLRFEGYSDWRLATIDELVGIYDPTQNANGWHTKGGIRVSGWIWSNSAGYASAQAWAFSFGSGKRASDPFKYSHHFRSLCVRRS